MLAKELIACIIFFILMIGTGYADESKKDKDKPVKRTVLTTMSIPDTPTTHYKLIDLESYIDKVINWFLNTTFELTHKNGDALNRDIIRAKDLVLQFNKNLKQSLNKTFYQDHIGKILANMLEDFKKVYNKIDDLSNQGKIILKKHSEYKRKSNECITFLDELIAIFEEDIKRVKSYQGSRELNSVHEDWLNTHRDTERKIRDIRSILVQLKIKIFNLIDLLNPFVEAITIEIPKEVRSSYNNVFVTIRSEQTHRCFQKLRSNRISFESIKRILKKQVKQILKDVPTLYNEVKEIESLYLKRYKDHGDEDSSVWQKIVVEIEDYQEIWNEMAINLESWNNDFWLDKIENRTSLILTKDIKYYIKDIVSDRIKSKESYILNKGTKVRNKGSETIQWKKYMILTDRNPNNRYYVIFEDAMEILAVPE